MSMARTAARYIRAYSRALFPKDPGQMEFHIANGDLIDVFDHRGGGTHKYIPTDRLNDELGLPRAAGVFSYILMADGSYLLRTCRNDKRDGTIAYWSGVDGEKAEWPTVSEN